MYILAIASEQVPISEESPQRLHQLKWRGRSLAPLINYFIIRKKYEVEVNCQSEYLAIP